MRTPFLVGCISLSVFAAGPASALDANLNFSGLILDACLITLGTPGVFVLNADGQSVTTENSVSATATVVTTSANFQIEALPPTQFSAAPNGGNDNVTFTTSLSANGVTSLLGVVSGITSPLGLGITLLEVDMTAERPNGGFPTGLYSATAVLRCTAI